MLKSHTFCSSPLTFRSNRLKLLLQPNPRKQSNRRTVRKHQSICSYHPVSQGGHEQASQWWARKAISPFSQKSSKHDFPRSCRLMNAQIAHFLFFTTYLQIKSSQVAAAAKSTKTVKSEDCKEPSEHMQLPSNFLGRQEETHSPRS